MQINSNTTAVVTGAGGGIGKSIAIWFAKWGASVVVSDIDGEAASNVVAELEKEHGAKFLAMKVDVSKLEEVEQLAASAYKRFGNVDILVNNAGVTMRPFRASWDTSYSDFKWMFDVNWWGVLHGHMAFVPRMRETPGPKHIVNTSSFGTLVAVGGHSAYSASKGAVDGFSNSAREELKTQNIGVSILYPGPVRTRIITSERLRPAEDQSEKRGVKPWSDYIATAASPALVETGPVDDPSFATNPYQYINPDEVGRFVVEAILENKPFILTHPPAIDRLEERVQQLIAGQPIKASGR